jgi:Cytochrome P460
MLRNIANVGTFAAIGLVAVASTAAYAQTTSFGGDKIQPPADLGTMYLTVDRADNKQFREYYANDKAVAAVKVGAALPAGSVLTGVLFKAKLDAQGTPLKGSDDRFIKDELIGYIVMEKQGGWGAGIPAEFRNSEWEYQVFTATKSVNDKANLKACYECHRDKVGAQKNFVFSLDQISKK